MSEKVEGLYQAIRALDRLDLDTVTDAELHDLVVSTQRERARLGVLAAELLGRWDRRGVWTGDGSRRAASRLARETNCATSSAKVELRRARQLASMPATAAAVGDGRLSLDHVDLLGRANRPWRDAVFADHEQVLVDECAKLRFADAARMAGYWCQRADAEAAEDEGRRRNDAAHLHASTTLDGDVELTGRLDPVGGAIFTTELERLERELYLADERDGVVRTRSQRQAAALVDMAARSAGVVDHGRRPRPLFTVLLGDDSFTRMCELANGTVIAPGQLVPWLGAAERETMLFDDRTTVVSVSQRPPSSAPSGAPHRDITRLDELRALIRWRNRHHFPPDDTDGGGERSA